MEECTPKLCFVTQTQELSDNPWLIVEGRIIYSLPSHTHPKSFAFICSVHFCVHEQRKAVQF